MITVANERADAQTGSDDDDARAWCTVREAAEIMGVSPNTAYKLLAADDFPVAAVRIGRKWRIPRRALIELFA